MGRRFERNAWTYHQALFERSECGVNDISLATLAIRQVWRLKTSMFCLPCSGPGIKLTGRSRGTPRPTGSLPLLPLT